MTTCNYAYRIVGPTSEPRRLVNATAAFVGYAANDPKAECEREAYLSAFCYEDEFCARKDVWGNVDTKDFNGTCSSPWIWWDIDRDGDLESALRDTRRLAVTLVESFNVGGNDLLVFYSGSKGFHLGLSTALWQPEPSTVFNRVTRRFAEKVADNAGVTIDTGVYDKVRAFRAPNSRHPKTGLFKRRLTLDELNEYSLERILQAARQPEQFQVPSSVNHSEQAATNWREAMQYVECQTAANVQRRAAVSGSPSVNRSTLDFIHHGANEGDRHRLLFSAAANLAEFGCPQMLAHALLTEAGLDSGLSPSEVRRQIDCGLARMGNAGGRHD
jgi:hypothetical protein